MGEETDAFELSDEDFDKVMSGESDEFTIEPSADTDLSADDEPADRSVSADDEASSADNLSADDASTDDASTDDLMDLFSDDDPPADDPPADEETFELIHQGRLVKVTKAEAINLAQQGYDYHEKTTRIAPHRKLLDLIDADEELQQKINQHVASKIAPKVTKREDYETEEEWLESNMTNAIASTNPTLVPGTENTVPGTQEQPPIVKALMARDPENFTKIGPVLKQVIGRLTVDQYNSITADPQKVTQLYDQVKQHVLSGHTVKPGQNQTAAKKKTFNLRSGQGPSKSRTPAKKNIWDLGNKDFNTLLSKVKGY